MLQKRIIDLETTVAQLQAVALAQLKALEEALKLQRRRTENITAILSSDVAKMAADSAESEEDDDKEEQEFGEHAYALANC